MAALQISCEQNILSVHGRRRSVRQVDDSLSDGTIENKVPDEMVLLMEVDEEYSASSSRRSETRRGTRSETRRFTRSETRRGTMAGERHSTRRSTRHSTLDESFPEVAKYKRVPWASQRRSTRSFSCSHRSDYRPECELAGEEAPALVAGISSMLNLRERVKHHNKGGYLSVMNVECIAPNRGAPSNQDLPSDSQKCDGIILPEQMVPVAPPELRTPESAKAARPHLRHRQLKRQVQDNPSGMAF